jgi:hypothetical protein
METRQFKDRIELFTERPDYIAEEKFKEYHRQKFLKSERFLSSERGKEYLKQQQAEKDKETKTDGT